MESNTGFFCGSHIGMFKSIRAGGSNTNITDVRSELLGLIENT